MVNERDREKKRFNFGIFKVMVQRTYFLIGILNTVMLAAIYLSSNEWLWWFWLVPAGLVAYALFEINIVWGQEIDAGIRRSKEWQEMKVDIKYLRENSTDNGLITYSQKPGEIAFR